MTKAAVSHAGHQSSGRDERIGILLVFLSALMWSFGGAIARFIEAESWTVVFWRSFWAATFLIGFMLWRDGSRGMIKLFRNMGCRASRWLPASPRLRPASWLLSVIRPSPTSC